VPFKRNNPGCNCCRSYGQVITEQERIQLNSDGQVTVWANSFGSHGCGYAPSFAGGCVTLDNRTLRRINISTGAIAGALAELPVSSVDGVFQECGGTVCVRNFSSSGQVYSVTSSGVISTFAVGSPSNNQWPMRIGADLFTVNLGTSIVYKAPLGGAPAPYYNLASSQGWNAIAGMVSDGSTLYLVGRLPTGIDLRIGSLTTPTSPTFTALHSFTLPGGFDALTLLDGALYFVGFDTSFLNGALYRYVIAEDAFEKILASTIYWPFHDNRGPGKSAIIEDAT
jgi:hypothetical protein